MNFIAQEKMNVTNKINKTKPKISKILFNKIKRNFSILDNSLDSLPNGFNIVIFFFVTISTISSNKQNLYTILIFFSRNNVIRIDNTFVTVFVPERNNVVHALPLSHAFGFVFLIKLGVVFIE